MSEKKTVTIKEVEAFADFVGIELLQCQKEMLVKFLNSDRSVVWYRPPRGSGYSYTRAQLELFIALFQADQSHTKLTQKE